VAVAAAKGQNLRHTTQTKCVSTETGIQYNKAFVHDCNIHMASADLNNKMLQPYLAERKRMEGSQNM
jgi:hypothetical protein